MLRLANISKSFAGVKALRNVSLLFKAGEVHALCGENGAGKTTLMNIIMGNLQPDEGTIFWNEKQLFIPDVLTAQSLGISIVYQERSLADSLSIAENIFSVRLPLTKAGLIDYAVLYEKTRRLLNDLGLSHLSPKTVTGKLSPALKQMVEIAKAIAQEPSLLILDEPTASITHSETEILFRIIRRLKEKGVGIVYISHRMAEIQQIADTISVLKDGAFVATVSNEASPQEIIKLMVGRELESLPQHSYKQAQLKLEAHTLSGKGFSKVSFQLYKGEILGFAGLQGSGRTALAKAIFGDEVFTEGKIYKDGAEYKPAHPSEALDRGVVYVPEERKTEGLFLEKSIAENIYAAQLKKGSYQKVIVYKESARLCNGFNVRTTGAKQAVRKLSGGNQQKIVLAKWMALQPDVLIVNEPTHGVDVGAKAEIYRLLKKFTAEGKSILLISSELPELLLLCDRIAVMQEGKLKAILNRAEATEEKITALASGLDNI